MPTVPQALNMFDGQRLWQSGRFSNVWQLENKIFDSGDPVNKIFIQFGAGAITPALQATLGCVIGEYGGSYGLWWVGNGGTGNDIAPTGFPGAISNLALLSSAWEKTGGAFFFNGAYRLFCIAQYNNGMANVASLVCLKSSDGGATWAVQDIANGPFVGSPQAVRWDGVSNKVTAFYQPASLFQYQFQQYNMTTDTWGASSASLPIPFDLVRGPVGGDLQVYPNGDVGVLYSYSAPFVGGIFYNLYHAGAWGAEVQKRNTPSRLATIIIDSSGTLLHCFYYKDGYIQTGGPGSGVPGHVSYFTLTQAGTASVDLFDFPLPIGFSNPLQSGFTDGVGLGATDGTTLFLPYDDWGDLTNAIWEGTLPAPTSFTKKLLPEPPIEAGNGIIDIGLHPGSIGYVVGDTGTINGGVYQLAQYRVLAVVMNAIASWSWSVVAIGYVVGDTLTVTTGNGDAQILVTSVDGLGRITGLIFTNLGSGYAIANNVPTTGGTGIGFQINILSLFNGVSSLTLDYVGLGYALANNVGTTTGGAQPGVGTGLIVDITQVGRIEIESCAQVYFSSFAPPSVVLSLDLHGAASTGPGAIINVNPPAGPPGPIVNPTVCVNQT